MDSNFKNWLIEKYGLKASVATSRVSNIARIERYYGNIDEMIYNGTVFQY